MQVLPPFWIWQCHVVARRRIRRFSPVKYKERLTLLDLLPLCLDRELKDLLFFYKCLYCSTDLDVRNYVSFVSRDRTRLSNSFNLRTPFCKTSSFQASYFNHIVKLWNYVCKLAPPTSFSSPTAFQPFVRKLMSTHLSRVYEINYPCTWTLVYTCPLMPLVIYFIFCTNVWVFILFYFNLGLSLGAVPRLGS